MSDYEQLHVQIGEDDRTRRRLRTVVQPANYDAVLAYEGIPQEAVLGIDRGCMMHGLRDDATQQTLVKLAPDAMPKVDGLSFGRRGDDAWDVSDGEHRIAAIRLRTFGLGEGQAPYWIIRAEGGLGNALLRPYAPSHLDSSSGLRFPTWRAALAFVIEKCCVDG